MTSETQANNYLAGSYTYNADGQRARRKVNGVETWQVYGTGGELLAEYAANAAPASAQKEYGYRNGQLLVTVGADGETPAQWINAVSVSIAGNSLTKTGFGRSAWNAGAVSEKGINSGDGYMEFTASETNKARRAGLSQGDTNQNWDDIDFCVFLEANGTVSINEGATLRGSFGTYASGDRFRVGVEGGVVKYRKNGVLLYTSTVVPGYPLIVDTSFFTVGATINNVVTYTTDLRWFVTDQLGTPRMIFDQSGSLAGASRHDYLPFGEELGLIGGRTTTQGYTAADGVRQKFTQKERDNETGLDYFGARYYASMQGRFVSADTVGFDLTAPQTLNMYRYALNNPVRYIDKDGHYETDVHYWLTKALAIAAGFGSIEATAIAWNTEAVDHDERGPKVSPETRELYHFTTPERRQALLDKANSDADKGFNARSIGEYLHALQDSLSHAGFGRWSGHFPSHKYDKTAFRPRDADLMAAYTYDALKNFAQKAKKTNLMTIVKPLDWDTVVRPYVEKFNRSSSISEKKSILADLTIVALENRHFQISSWWQENEVDVEKQLKGCNCKVTKSQLRNMLH